MDRFAATWDCYLNLKYDLTKDGSERMQQNDQNGKKVKMNVCYKKTTPKTNYTFIAFGTEDEDEYQRLICADHPHIIHAS